MGPVILGAVLLALVFHATASFGAVIWLLAVAIGSIVAIVSLALSSRDDGSSEREGAYLVGGSVAAGVLAIGGAIGFFSSYESVDFRRLDECIEGTRVLTGASYREASAACEDAQRRQGR